MYGTVQTGITNEQIILIKRTVPAGNICYDWFNFPEWYGTAFYWHQLPSEVDTPYECQHLKIRFKHFKRNNC